MNIWSLLPSVLGIAVAIGLVWWLSKNPAILKDHLIPQIAANRQTYSLARSQMAFWFVIILASFLYLFILFALPHSAAPDPVTTGAITSQTLALLGISALTAGGAAYVDYTQNTPEDALNDALSALGLKTYQDVIDLDSKIAGLKALGGNATVVAQSELNNLLLLKQTYVNRTLPFETNGWFRDMTSDIDGTALHRLQALIWTALIGGLFVYELCLHGAMPQLDEHLLALMGISNAGYVGFKTNETQY